MKKPDEHYRAVSWWMTWRDLEWPDEGIADKMKRRADRAAEAGVNCAVIFGTHFRWDYMPLWSRLHDMFTFIADELHQRDIMLFDHHSAVLTHRPRNMEDAWSIWRRNRHHVPFYPSIDEASQWTFEGKRINDWRMIDVETGEPSFLPFYVAEEFCINNPHFIKAYQGYVRRLVKETGIDGLMSDDGIFYDGWRACGCRWCRQRFQNEYGHSLPPTDDRSFWGKRDSEAFKDWIEMRFCSSSDFLGAVREVLDPDFPLMACCSTSEANNLPSVGMTYQDFIKSCSLIMLEMCGSTPGLDGTWDGRISSQLLHLGIARDNNCPCFGLGYAFSTEPAFFIWAFNKFLGSDTWFSTLKGRLGMPDSELEDLPDDPDLVGEGFTWEKDHPHLFTGKPDTQTAVFFSRSTRDYYGQIPGDYVLDYQTTCSELMKGKVNFEVVTEIPDVRKWGILVMGSVVCLSREEAEKLHEYLRGGGIIVATGMLGLRDGRAVPVEKPWLEKYGIELSVDEPERAAGFPPYDGIEPIVAECRGLFKGREVEEEEWIHVKAGEGQLFWCPSRIGAGKHDFHLVEIVSENEMQRSYAVEKSPEGWYLRTFRDGGRILIHGLPAKIKIETHPKLKKRYISNDEEIVYKLRYEELRSYAITMAFSKTPASITVYSPDLEKPRIVEFSGKTGRNAKGGQVDIDLSGISRYFVVEIVP
jgi:hypothetical protein